MEHTAALSPTFQYNLISHLTRRCQITGTHRPHFSCCFMFLLILSSSLSFFVSSILFSTTHCSLLRLIVRSRLDVLTFATRRLYACRHARANSGGRWNCEREMSGKFCLNAYFHVTFRNLLHTVKLRHKTDGFTSPLKEGVLRIFFPKIPTALAGFEPANLGTKGQRLIVQSGLDLSTLATRRLHACHHARVPSGGRWNCGREMSGKFCLKCRLTRYI